MSQTSVEGQIFEGNTLQKLGTSARLESLSVNAISLP